MDFMMELAAMIDKLVTVILGGGPGAVIAFLLGTIIYLIYEKQQLNKKYAEIVEKIQLHNDEASEAERKEYLDVINRYHQGQLNTLDAIQQLHILLARIEGRL